MLAWLGCFYPRRTRVAAAWVWTLQWEGDVALLQCLPLAPALLASRTRAAPRISPICDE
jgi:hypothetical protein